MVRRARHIDILVTRPQRHPTIRKGLIDLMVEIKRTDRELWKSKMLMPWLFPEFRMERRDILIDIMETYPELMDEVQNAQTANPDSSPPPYSGHSTQSYTESSSQRTLKLFLQKSAPASPKHPAEYIPHSPYPLLNKTAMLGPESQNPTWAFYPMTLEVTAITFCPQKSMGATTSATLDLSRLQMAFVEDLPWLRYGKRKNETLLFDDRSRAGTTELCCLVRDLQGEIAKCRWLLVHARTKFLAVKFLLDPIEHFQLDFEFVLELIGRCHFEYGSPKSTLLDYWTASWCATDLCDAIASHLLILRRLEPPQQTRWVLNDYVAEFLKRDGLEEVSNSAEFQEESLMPGEMCCWPLSDEYGDLARALRAFAYVRLPYDPYESS